jgi:hypothetical protein
MNQTQQYSINEAAIAKWKAVLDDEGEQPIKNRTMRSEIAKMLENTERELGVYNDGSQFLFETSVPTNAMGLSSTVHGTGAIDTFDPILISLIRRAMPNLVAFEGLCGVQTMTGPTGLIFAMRSRYAPAVGQAANQSGSEAFYVEANTGYTSFGGTNSTANSVNFPNIIGVPGSNDIPTSWTSNSTAVGGAANNIDQNANGYVGNFTAGIPAISNNAANATYNYGGALSTYLVEGLGSNGTAIFPEMAFSIEKVTAYAGSRAMKAEYSMELVQDLKAIHGLDAEAELSNILSTEILAEINREIVRCINITAVPGSQTDTTTAGQFDLDVDSNGRWLQEKFLGMYYQLDREANVIAKQTRRGKGNVMICSADIASALNGAKVLTYDMKDRGDLTVDDTGNTFVGRLNSGMKVFIDPYAIGGQYWTVGWRGSNPMDAGVFYCPYVPLQMVRAVDPLTFQPKIAFKTRYAMVANPFAQGLTQGLGALIQDSNVYYRRTIVQHLQ